MHASAPEGFAYPRPELHDTAALPERVANVILAEVLESVARALRRRAAYVAKR